MHSTAEFLRAGRGALGRFHADPRHWQLVGLSGLLTLSWLGSDFGSSPLILAAALCGALGVEALGAWWRRRRGRNHKPLQWKSALITAFGVSLLLRADALWIWSGAAAFAIAAKLLLRWNGKQLFNPACSGILAALWLSGGQAWISAGQWGQTSLVAGYALAMAALTLSSARRLDIALGFLGSFAALAVTRAVWLGDPLAIAWHQLSSGSLLIFAFFMVTDPRSTPDSRRGRLLFAAAVAVLASALHWGPNVQAAPLVALAAIGLLTPLLDRHLPGRRFRWAAAERRPLISQSLEAR
ncbi:MAG: RnfABCDGE type electron transport complex subunit D [Pseudomonadota bacterium]